MKYAVLIYDTETANPSPEPPPAAEADAMMREYFAYSKLLTDRQANLGGEALQPATTATTLRMKDGAIVTTDGPFAETKEALGGF